MMTHSDRIKAHDGINHILIDLFPAHAMTARPAQIELSHQILDTMLDGGIALFDAGTGIGKTYAYLAAGAAFDRCRAAGGLGFQPILFSTSSIALQNAIQNEYIPFLSDVLMEDGFIDRPIRTVIRKGKSHYVCEERLQKRLKKAGLKKKNRKTADALLTLKTRLDLDEVAQLSNYDRERVCVPQYCDCGRGSCRYLRFLERCHTERFLFHICNHNLLLADAIQYSSGRRPLLPRRAAIVIDEAHKLPEAAWQMFGITVCADDIRAMIDVLKTEQFFLLSDTLRTVSRPLLNRLDEPWDVEYSIDPFLRLLTPIYQTLNKITRQISNMTTRAARRKLYSTLSAVSLLCEGNADLVLYTDEGENGGTILCAATGDLVAQMKRALWSQPCGIVLTSGTLAVGDDFRRFRQAVGLPADSHAVKESVFLSPFDYQQNCLLYLPRRPPRKRGREPTDYYDSLTDETADLIRAAHGHTLALFTSYAELSAVEERLRKKELPYPLFTLRRNAVHTVERFRKTPGSVLLAAGAAWEGFDFPGDCVSLLIIPQLPFPFPDARKERERETYPTLREFIRVVVVPEMQIKLRQGFGRAIRTETDACVTAILDERAAPGSRYYPDVIAALPDMEQTRCFRTIKQFYRAVKPDKYFREGRL